MPRNCALWISPWVEPHDRYYIVDTAALGNDPLTAALLRGPDKPPDDTVLVVVHPREAKRIQQMYDDAWKPLQIVDALMTDPNGRNVASIIVNERCTRDPDLRQRLRWN